MTQPRREPRRALVARGAPLRDIVTGRSPRPPGRLRPHPQTVRDHRPRAAHHPVAPHPATVPRVPVAATPDVGLSRPIGSAGGPPLPASGGFGPKPPATVGHWLGQAGGHLVAGPAMLAVATEMHKMGYFARRQLGNTWQHIHDLKTTIR